MDIGKVDICRDWDEIQREISSLNLYKDCTGWSQKRGSRESSPASWTPDIFSLDQLNTWYFHQLVGTSWTHDGDGILISQRLSCRIFTSQLKGTPDYNSYFQDISPDLSSDILKSETFHKPVEDKTFNFCIVHKQWISTPNIWTQCNPFYLWNCFLEIYFSSIIVYLYSSKTAYMLLYILLTC